MNWGAVASLDVRKALMRTVVIAKTDSVAASMPDLVENRETMQIKGF